MLPASIPASKNVWYFAYGSNMSTAKFIGGRGIHPLDVARVRLPGWILSMEIPGVPYSEPAFSSVRPADDALELGRPEVLGVAYLITPAQHRTVIASEGGGTAYDDISVDARPVTDEDAAKTGHALQVRTLGTAMKRWPLARPSERYMDIITAGAAEAGLPTDYQDYLNGIPIYHPSKQKRHRLGAAIFLAFWGPVMSLLERIVHLTFQEDGNSPPLVKSLVRLTMMIIWFTHDNFFAPIYGRGDGLDDKGLEAEINQPLLLEKDI